MPPAAPDIRDIKPPVELPGSGWLWWAAAAAVLALAVALAVWLLRRRRARAGARPAPPLRPAGEAALEALARLWDELESGRLDAQAFFFGVSATLRAYVEARFDLNATDLTTAEIRSRLVGAAFLSPALGAELVELLELADLVKFARAEARPRLRQEALERAQRFVAATTPPPGAAPGPAGVAMTADAAPPAGRPAPSPAGTPPPIPPSLPEPAHGAAVVSSRDEAPAAAGGPPRGPR